MTNIDKIKELMRESEEAGESFALQSLVNYIEQVLGLKVKYASANSGDCTLTSNITAFSEKHNITYKFTNEYYQPEFNMSRANMLILRTIQYKQKIVDIDKRLFLNKSNENKNSKLPYFKKSFTEIIEEEKNDLEIKLVVNCIKKELDSYNIKYEYKEENPGVMETFIIKGDGFKISEGFNNTIQFGFDKDIGAIQVVYRGVIDTNVKYDVMTTVNFLSSYLQWELKLHNHNISKLYDGLVETGYGSTLRTKPFTIGRRSPERTQDLFDNFVIVSDGLDTDEYKQLEVNIAYDLSKKQFILTVGYLFKNTIIVLDTVDEVVEMVRELKETIQ